MVSVVQAPHTAVRTNDFENKLKLAGKQHGLEIKLVFGAQRQRKVQPQATSLSSKAC